MTTTGVKLVSVAELLDKKYFIRSYQRGYRWDENQVQDEDENQVSDEDENKVQDEDLVVSADEEDGGWTGKALTLLMVKLLKWLREACAIQTMRITRSLKSTFSSKLIIKK